MRRMALSSLVRLAALALASTCGWIALATSQNAVVRVCTTFSRGHPVPSAALCTVEPPALSRVVWRAGPTAAMSVAALAAIALALVAVSPRQGTLLMYRWRRTIY